MKRLIRACSSTIGKKYLMAVTGLMLCGFLVVHLAGNLLLYVGPEAYNSYAQTLHENEGLLLVAEVGLAAVFVLHIWLAFSTARDNRAARKQRYLVKESKLPQRLSVFNPENWMLVSGVFILGFLVVHLVDFTFLLRPDIDYAAYEGQEFRKAAAILSTPFTKVVYAVGCLWLGLHLGHGVASSFQSLGWNHPNYQSLIHWVGVVFAFLIAVGFVSFVFVQLR